MFSRILSATAFALLASQTFAQTSASCDPLNATCPSDAALGTTYQQVFNSSSSALSDKYWNITAGSDLITSQSNGLQFSLAQEGQSITAQTSFYIFWGEVEIQFQAAAGPGLVSTMNFLSDDLDEIDVEVIGSNSSFVSTNWYGQGNQTQANAVWYPVDGTTTKMHSYKVVWNQNSTQWIFDGNVVRTLPAAAPKQYPQTPCYIKMGVWPAGDSSSPGTVEWAGGKVNWAAAPFTMTVASIKITDGTTNSTSYAYPPNGDGAWQGIKIDEGRSDAAAQIQKAPPQTAEQKWQGLSTTAKIAIAASVIGVLVIAFVFFMFYCIRRRRQGARMRIAEDEQWNQQQTELMSYRNNWNKSEYSISQQPLTQQRW